MTHKTHTFSSAIVCSGTSQGSSKAGFPWWAGLIIALVVLALVSAVAGLACLSRARRRRRRGVSLEESMQKQVPVLPCRHLTATGQSPLCRDDCPVQLTLPMGRPRCPALSGCALTLATTS